MDWRRIKDGDIETYNAYCNELEELIVMCVESDEDETENDEIRTLQLIVDDYDTRHRILTGDPLTAPQLIRIAMLSRGIKKNITLAKKFGVSEGLVSAVLNYKKPISKNFARALAEEFSFDMDDLLREYPLTGEKVETLSSVITSRRDQLIKRKMALMEKLRQVDAALGYVDGQEEAV